MDRDHIEQIKPFSKDNEFIFDDRDATVIYEVSYKARLKWKRNDICFACAGYGRFIVHKTKWSNPTKTIKRNITCSLCAGTGLTRYHLSYNSGHREI